jgi:hypothetical protein
LLFGAESAAAEWPECFPVSQRAQIRRDSAAEDKLAVSLQGLAERENCRKFSRLCERLPVSMLQPG